MADTTNPDRQKENKITALALANGNVLMALRLVMRQIATHANHPRMGALMQHKRDLEQELIWLGKELDNVIEDKAGTILAPGVEAIKAMAEEAGKVDALIRDAQTAEATVAAAGEALKLAASVKNAGGVG